jgi:hypothetical protein
MRPSRACCRKVHFSISPAHARQAGRDEVGTEEERPGLQELEVARRWVLRGAYPQAT